MRCHLCSPITLLKLLDTEYLHHSGFTALASSVQSGCDFCRLIWTCFEEEHGREALQKNYEHVSVQIILWSSAGWLPVNKRQAEKALPATIDLKLVRSDEDEGHQWLMSAAIHVCGPPDVPFPHQTFATDPQLRYGDPARLSLARKWIDRCRNTHGSLCWSTEEAMMPTRVIDVGLEISDDSVRLVETTDLNGPYVILSYCWGSDPQLTTTRDLLKAHLQHINLDTLSQTVKDAIVVTRSLGVRYLWVDALCIVQSSPNDNGPTEDFLREAPKMVEYYSNSFVTILAEDANRCQDGFLDGRPDHSELVPIRFADVAEQSQLPHDSVSSHGPLYAFHLASRTLSTKRPLPLRTRSWALQEKLLSKRRIVFGRNQIYFACETTNFSDDGSGTPFMQADQIGPRRPPDRFSLLKARGDEEWLHSNALFSWYRTLNDYSKGRLTHYRDIFAAVEGMTALHYRFLQSRFLWGIWECDLIRGLLWKQMIPASMRFNDWDNPRRADPSLGIPSWSWASIACVHDVIYRTDGKGSPSPELRQTSSLPSIFGPENVCVKFLNSAEIEDSHDPIYSPTGGQRMLIIEGSLTLLRAERNGYTKHRSSLFRFEFKNKRGALLYPILDGETSEATDTSSKIVAEAAIDIAAETLPLEIWCLPLVRDAGLMLARREDDKFVRIGLVGIVDKEYFSNRPLQIIRLS